MTKEQRDFFYGKAEADDAAPESRPDRLRRERPEMKRGWVKYWSGRHGDGTIAQNDGGPSLYFHASGVVGCGFKTFTSGQFVEYDIGINKKGPVAFNVRPLRPDEVEGRSR